MLLLFGTVLVSDVLSKLDDVVDDAFGEICCRVE